ncbi:PIN domain-containing protein [bacterium]|nr:MAG: PIN domain-containing protein [bacterium]
MVNGFVADANVFIAAILPERGSAAAINILASARSVRMPTLCQTEVAHILLRQVRRQLLSYGEAEAAFATFLAIPNLHREIDPVFEHSIFKIALDRNLGSNDLIYTLLAQRFDLPLVTADAGLLANASGLCQCVDLRTL